MKLKTALLAAAIAATGLFATTAGATDGTITFNGSVTASTCTVNGGTGSFTVTLPKVGTNAFTAVGNYAGRTPFAINLTACSGTGTVKAYFEPGSNILASGHLKNNGTAGGLDLQMLNDTQGPINLSTQGGTTTATIASSAATLNYFVQYYATSASVTAGSITSTVDYTIQYP